MNVAVKLDFFDGNTVRGKFTWYVSSRDIFVSLETIDGTCALAKEVDSFNRKLQSPDILYLHFSTQSNET